MLSLRGFVLAFNNPNNESLMPVIEKFGWTKPTVAVPKATKRVGRFNCELSKKDSLVLVSARSAEDETHQAIDAMMGNLIAEFRTCGLSSGSYEENGIELRDVNPDSEDDEP